MPNIIRISAQDILEMKKTHPCGSTMMKVLRTGSDIRIKCVICGRDVTVPRIKLEKSIKRVIPADQTLN